MTLSSFFGSTFSFRPKTKIQFATTREKRAADENFWFKLVTNINHDSTIVPINIVFFSATFFFPNSISMAIRSQRPMSLSGSHSISSDGNYIIFSEICQAFRGPDSIFISRFSVVFNSSTKYIYRRRRRLNLTVCGRTEIISTIFSSKCVTQRVFIE